MKYNHVLMATVLTVFICLTLQAQHQHKQETQIQASQQAAKEVYSCPMHPEVISDTPGECPKCGMKLEKQATEAEQSPSSMMGKPTFEQTTQGLNIRVWLITQTEHKQMMKDHGMIGGAKKGRHEMMGMMHGEKEENKDAKDHHMMDEGAKHDGKEMSTETMETMMAGTHHVMVMVTDVATKKAIDSAGINIAVTSPSNNSSTIELKSMMGHFGGGLTLDEKGAYTLDVWVSDKEKIRTVSFSYEIK